MKTFKIGRASDSDILCTHLEVSNNHADLIEENGSYTLVDHSRNGTFVNRSHIHHNSCTVRRGDSVVFAGVEELNWNKVSRIGKSTIPMRDIKPSTVFVPYEKSSRLAPFGVPSMVCGIVSLISCISAYYWAAHVLAYEKRWIWDDVYSNDDIDFLLSLGTIGWSLGLSLAILALCLGVRGVRRVRGQEYAFHGKGMLNAGKVCGIIGICFNGLPLFFVLLGLILGGL